MNIKSAIGIFKKSGAISVYNEVKDGELMRQWITDGTAIYPLDINEAVSENTLCDISGLNKEKMVFIKRDFSNIDVRDYSEYDIEGEKLETVFKVKDTEYAACNFEGELSFFDSQYLKPIRGEDLSFFCRGKLIAVKKGFVIEALIYPFENLPENMIDDCIAVGNLFVPR